MLDCFSVQAMPITSAVKITRHPCQTDYLDLHSRSQLRLKLDNSLTCSLIVNISDNIEAVAFNVGMTVDLCMAYIYIYIYIDDLELDARPQWIARRGK